eukprot:c52958_g1_i1 orf=94-279(+)
MILHRYPSHNHLPPKDYKFPGDVVSPPDSYLLLPPLIQSLHLPVLIHPVTQISLHALNTFM